MPSNLLQEAVRETQGDIFKLDILVYGNRWVLAPHQVYLYDLLERHPIVWIEASRGAGKTSTLARYYSLKRLLRPEWIVTYIGPSYRQALIPWRYEVDFITHSPLMALELARKPTKDTLRAAVSYTNGSMSVALPASGDKIRGHRTDSLVISEAHDIGREFYLSVVRWMLSGGRSEHERTRVFETSAGVQSSFAYALRAHHLQQMAAGDARRAFASIDLEDLKAEGFISDREYADIVGDRVLGDAIWRQANLNEWLALSGAFYTWEMVNRPDIKRVEVETKATDGFTYVAGSDLAWATSGHGADSAFVVWRIDPKRESPPAVVYAEAWPSNAMPLDQLARVWVDLIRRFRLSALVLDLAGAGVAVLQKLDGLGYLRADDPQPSVKPKIIVPFPHSNERINEAHSLLRAAFESGELSLPTYPAKEYLRRYHDTVNAALTQLADLKVSTTEGGSVRFDAPTGRKKDLAYALLYGFWKVVELTRVPAPPPIRPRGSPIIESELGEALLGLDPRLDWTPT